MKSQNQAQIIGQTYNGQLVFTIKCRVWKLCSPSFQDRYIHSSSAEEVDEELRGTIEDHKIRNIAIYDATAAQEEKDNLGGLTNTAIVKRGFPAPSGFTTIESRVYCK